MSKKIMGIFVVFIMMSVVFSGCLGPGDRKSDPENTPGATGISWADMVPIKKATFVGYDPDSYIDDYAYLAAVPSSVFYSAQNEKMYSNPLLFYEQPMGEGDDEKRVLNANQGIQYFMEDWLVSSGGALDNVQMINMKKEDESTVEKMVNGTVPLAIYGSTPGEIAANIALNNWEYSDAAVVAVVEDDYSIKPELESFTVTGKTPSASVQKGEFHGEAEPDPVNPIEHPFEIGEDYKYVEALMTWGSDYNPIADITERGKDPDLQLYDDQLGEVAASEEWNVLSGASEFIGSYVYNAGGWRATVTYMPTESDIEKLYLEEKYGESQAGFEQGPAPESSSPEAGVEVENNAEVESPADNVEVVGTGSETPGIEMDDAAGPNPFSHTAVYTIEYTLYPGIDIELPEQAPYGCRNAYFTLEWSDSSQQLGLLIRGSSGAEISMAISPSEVQTIKLPELGEGTHHVAVINLADNAQATEFQIEYGWEQTLRRAQSDGFASAAEGAVYASTQNIPMLYTSKSKFDKVTQDAMDTLGVTKVYYLDIGKHGDSSIINSMKDSRSLLQEKLEVTHISTYRQIYDMIKESTRFNNSYQNDVVFTTLNPWTYWGVMGGPLGDFVGEHEKGLYIGPATFAAAHHGCPVFITESDARLSNAQAWHNEFWRNAWDRRPPPSVGCMVLTGREVYEFLDDYGFDYKDKQESILTVAGQFDIGTSWDRMLVGAATSGRIGGSPVDSAYWISRAVFYKTIIFANPAVNPELDDNGGKRITGSRSVRVAGALRIVEGQKEIEAKYPVAQSWVSYDHRFNERGSQYWGSPYVTATGITPFFDKSDDPSTDLGGVWPDLTTSEIVPYYIEKAGYSSVYTTNFDTTVENLNRGAIMWLEVMHGGNSQSGIVGFWDESQPEPNPWRAYEENALYMRGSTADPDVVSMNKHIGLDIQPGAGPIFGGPRRESHDGVVIAIAQQQQTTYKTGYDFDDNLDNLHSMGMSAGSCLIANAYLHLTIMRHGSVFQIIDPWLTSWYSSFAMETFCRDLIYGYNVGQAYERGIKHVGIQYLTDHWWWDIYENVVYYGDPDLRVFTPQHKWERPNILAEKRENLVIEGHAPFGAKAHPYAIADTTLQEAGLYSSAVIVPIAIVYLARRRKKKNAVLRAQMSQG